MPLRLVEPVVQLPHPYLTTEEVNDRLRIINPNFRAGEDNSAHLEVLQINQAIQELIAGAIAEWADVKDDLVDQTPEEVNDELLSWADDWLIR